MENNFEELLEKDDVSIQKMLKVMDLDTLAIALKGENPSVKDKITKNMSEKACADLEGKIAKLGKIKPDEKEECQLVVLSYVG